MKKFQIEFCLPEFDSTNMNCPESKCFVHLLENLKDVIRQTCNDNGNLDLKFLNRSEPAIATLDERKQLRFDYTKEPNGIILFENYTNLYFELPELKIIALALGAGINQCINKYFGIDSDKDYRDYIRYRLVSDYKAIWPGKITTNYILEVREFKEGFGFKHIGYINRLFNTEKKACCEYDKRFPRMRSLNAFSTLCSDWDPDTKLRYLIRPYNCELLTIEPFS